MGETFRRTTLRLRNKILWSDETKIEPLGLNSSNQAPLITCPRPSQQWSMVVVKQHHAVRVFFSSRDWGSRLRESWTEQITEISLSAEDLRLGWRFSFQQDNETKHSAKTAQEWLRENSVNVLDWPSRNPHLDAIENLWRDLKMSVCIRFPSNLEELERIYREQWQKISKSGWAKLHRIIPKKTQGCNRGQRYWVEGLNIYAMRYFSFFSF